MTQFINLTPHAITINADGIDAITVQPSGFLARVTVEEVIAGTRHGFPVITRKAGAVDFGGVFAPDATLLVSSMVLDAIPADHALAGQCFAPDTGTTAQRNDKGHIVSVSRLVGK